MNREVPAEMLAASVKQPLPSFSAAKDSSAAPATALDFDSDGLLDVYIGYFGDASR